MMQNIRKGVRRTAEKGEGINRNLTRGQQTNKEKRRKDNLIKMLE